MNAETNDKEYGAAVQHHAASEREGAPAARELEELPLQPEGVGAPPATTLGAAGASSGVGEPGGGGGGGGAAAGEELMPPAPHGAIARRTRAHYSLQASC